MSDDEQMAAVSTAGMSQPSWVEQIRAEVREACAKIADLWLTEETLPAKVAAAHIAAAIRAGGG